MAEALTETTYTAAVEADTREAAALIREALAKRK